MSANLERLQSAGIALDAKEPYLSIANELSEHEIEALISVKRRFDDKIEVQGHRASDPEPPDEFFAFF